MAGLGATIAAKSASSLHQTVLLGATSSTSTSQNTCVAVEIYEEEKGDDNNNNKLPPPPPHRQSDSVSAEPTNPTAAATCTCCNEIAAGNGILNAKTNSSTTILRSRTSTRRVTNSPTPATSRRKTMLPPQRILATSQPRGAGICLYIIYMVR